MTGFRFVRFAVAIAFFTIVGCGQQSPVKDEVATDLNRPIAKPASRDPGGKSPTGKSVSQQK